MECRRVLFRSEGERETKREREKLGRQTKRESKQVGDELWRERQRGRERGRDREGAGKTERERERDREEEGKRKTERERERGRDIAVAVVHFWVYWRAEGVCETNFHLASGLCTCLIIKRPTPLIITAVNVIDVPLKEYIGIFKL